MGEELTVRTDSTSVSRNDSIPSSQPIVKSEAEVAGELLALAFNQCAKKLFRKHPFNNMTPRELMAKFQKAKAEYDKIKQQMDSTSVSADTVYQSSLDNWIKLKNEAFEQHIKEMRAELEEQDENLKFGLKK